MLITTTTKNNNHHHHHHHHCHQHKTVKFFYVKCNVNLKKKKKELYQYCPVLPEAKALWFYVNCRYCDWT